MSAIGEAKEQIAAASDEADQAIGAVGQAMQSVDEALSLIGQAAEDSGHDKVEEAQRMCAEPSSGRLRLGGPAGTGHDEIISHERRSVGLRLARFARACDYPRRRD